MTIQSILKTSKLTQAQFSARYGIPKQTLSGWMTGNASPPDYVLNLLKRSVREDSNAEKISVAELRKKTGLSQVKFAKKYGIPRRTLEDWERNVSKPPVYVSVLLGRAVRSDLEAELNAPPPTP